MKYRTQKSPRRSPWSRFTRWLARVVDDLTRNEYAGLPQTLDEHRATRWTTSTTRRG